LGEDKPFIMVTDPPYGVNYNPGWRNRALKETTHLATKVENDDRADWKRAYFLFPGDVVYIWHAGLSAGQFFQDLVTAGFPIRAQIIWAKGQKVFSQGHYHWQHEPCWYAVRKGKKSNWKGDRKQSTLWQVAGLNPAEAEAGAEDSRTLHSTQKPLELFRRPIVNHTDAGDMIYDPFAGSGTALVAAEQLGRVCLAMELDPGYLAVCLERLAGLGLIPVLDEEKQ
jgi:DNA modification methylase